MFSGSTCRLTVSDILFDSLKLICSVVNLPAGPLPSAVMELNGAYSSSSSCDDIEESCQRELCDTVDDEDRSDDVIAGAVEKAQDKPKSFGAELQMHNYFSSPAKQPSAEEKV